MTEPDQLAERKALNAALAAAQGEFPAIVKDKKAKAGAYEYAYVSLETIIEAIRPVLSKHGLAFLQPLTETGVRTELRHTAGGVIAYTMPWPERMPEGIQAQGSLITYVKRYSLTAMLGIAAEEDDDGEAAQKAKPMRKERKEDEGWLTEQQRKAIFALKRKLINAGKLTEEQFEGQIADDYGATVSGLSRREASELIDRMSAAEKKLANVSEPTLSSPTETGTTATSASAVSDE